MKKSCVTSCPPFCHSESYKVDLAENGAQALEMIREKDYGVMLLDLMMPDVDGFQVLEELKKSENSPVAVVLTAYASIDRVMQAAKLNAFAFIPKPFKNDELLLAVKNAMAQYNLAVENRRLKKSLHERYGFQNLVGKSALMQQVFDLIAQVAPRRSTVLIQGESGTGKELVAKAIHASSGRVDAPFIAINCGNIPSDLLESELFGHVRGAYTGATTPKRDCLRLPMEERFSWMKCLPSPRRSRSSFFGSFRSGSSAGWGVLKISRWMSASSRPRTRTFKPP